MRTSASFASFYLSILGAIVSVSLAVGQEIKSTQNLTEDVQKDLRNVINQWNSDRALDRKPGVIISSQLADLHLKQSDSRFDKYTLQVGNSTYSTVHLQKKQVFNAAVIRKAFQVSMDTRSHVLFTQPFGIHSHPGNQMYFACQLSNKKGYTYWVWTVRETYDTLKSKLGITTCESPKSTNDFFADVLGIDR